MNEYHTDGNHKDLPSAEMREEVERAIDNARRTPWDKWFRRQWYRAGAKRMHNDGHNANR